MCGYILIQLECVNVTGAKCSLSSLVLHFPLKLVAPSHVSAQAVSADSIKVSWTPAPTASSVSVTYYINAFSSTCKTVRTMTDPDRDVVISGLHPFAEYDITVLVGNPGGLSEPMGRSATTLTAGYSALPEL